MKKKTSYRRPKYEDVWHRDIDHSSYKPGKKMRTLNKVGINISGNVKGPNHWIMKASV